MNHIGTVENIENTHIVIFKNCKSLVLWLAVNLQIIYVKAYVVYFLCSSDLYYNN